MLILSQVYIPVVNHTVFKHSGITWEWGIVVGCLIVYVAGIEIWKVRTLTLYTKTLQIIIYIGNQETFRYLLRQEQRPWSCGRGGQRLTLHSGITGNQLSLSGLLRANASASSKEGIELLSREIGRASCRERVF